jgi:type IV pilus assembly protein PilO
MAFTMDSILKLSKAKKILMLVGILVIMTGLYFQSFFSPRQEELKILDGDLNKLVKELNDSKAITRDYQKFKEQVAKLNEELKNALTQLPNEKEIPEILKTITSLGKESNLEFAIFKPKAEEPQQFYANVPIELTVTGSYHNTGIFFDKVGKLPRIINVVDFNMTRAKEVKGKVESEVLVKTSCLVHTYRSIEKKIEEKKSEKKAGLTETEASIEKPQSK